MQPVMQTVADTDVDLSFWEKNGYYVCPGLFSAEEMDRVVESAKASWVNRDARVVVDTQIYDPAEKRVHDFISNLSEEDRKRRFVLNDMYLWSEAVRAAAIAPKLTHVLRTLMGKEPVLIQSLNFNWGTNQGLHQDTLYLPPPNEEDFLAVWIALEDIHPDAGPLRYVAGSHKIPRYHFSTGKVRVVNEESHLWEEHIAKYMKLWGMKEEVQPPKKGDVFVWHGYLVHGGSDIKNFDLTRKSLVCHYYALDDMKTVGAQCNQEFGGYWWQRGPQI